jgi:hypothetical protein
LYREYDIFSTWSQDVLQKVAEESRSMEFGNNVVIDNNLLQTDMLHVVIEVCSFINCSIEYDHLDLKYKTKYRTKS